MDCPRVGNEGLKACAGRDLEARGFKGASERVFLDQIDKVVQMYETQLVRHTTMIVGPTGGGKSLVLDTLKNARLANENVVVKMFVLNPKVTSLQCVAALPPISLLTALILLLCPWCVWCLFNLRRNPCRSCTARWTQSLETGPTASSPSCSESSTTDYQQVNTPSSSPVLHVCDGSSASSIAAGKENEMRWIVYDGDVDALWVENMNSVMDDNRLLTLPNGERIRLQPYCAMICETFDLQFASPATISRCGMVWVDPKNLGFKPYYERWIKQRFGNGVAVDEEEAKQGLAEMFNMLYEKYVPKSMDLILKGLVDGEMGQKLKQVIPISNIDLAKQLCSVVDAFIPVEMSDPTDVEMMYIFCIVWSLGAQLVGKSRVVFDTFIKKVSRESLPESLIYDSFYDLKTHRWEKWQTQVHKYEEPTPFRFYEVRRH